MKPVIRQALAEQIARLPKRFIAKSRAGVGSWFTALLDDPRINRYERRYRAISALCRRWGAEVGCDPNRIAAECAPFTPRIAARPIRLKGPVYRPYLLRDVRNAVSNSCIAVEAFAGGGGSGVGLHLAGFTVVLANEFVPEAARSYSANFPDVVIDTSDIRTIVGSRQTVERFLEKAGLTPLKVALLSGSCPCSPFCNLGGGLCDPAEVRRYSDTRQASISTLIFDYVALVRFALPMTIVSENVPNLAGVYSGLLNAALDILRFTSSGERVYFAAHAVLSAEDFGTPQVRSRLFIVGVRRDVAQAVGIHDDADVLRVFPDPTHLPVGLRSAFDGLVQNAAEVRPWRDAMSTSSVLREVASKLPKNPIDLIRPLHVGLPTDAWFSTVRCSWDRPAPTMTVIGQQPNGLSGALHPDQDRKFTLPELKRLTGLPDDFRLTGSLSQGAERVCRMVPPLLMSAVASSIYQKVLRPYYGA